MRRKCCARQTKSLLKLEMAKNPTNPLAALFDRFCSDKGTFWQSRHHYANAYHSLFQHVRPHVRNLVEIGIGEDTAPSVAAWLRYFPQAHIHAIDIKDAHEFAERAAPYGATERLVNYQARFGCEYDRTMWRHSRVHLTLGVDASDPRQLARVRLPTNVDVIIDDGSHRLRDQEATMRSLWPLLRPGGYYVVEDVLVGALPWDDGHRWQVPTRNSECGHECFFPQKPAEHPLLYDRFRQYSTNETRLQNTTRQILANNDWFWVLTGVHKGGGVDASLVVRKQGQLELAPAHAAVSWTYVVCMGSAIAAALYCTCRPSRFAYHLLKGSEP